MNELSNFSNQNDIKDTKKELNEYIDFDSIIGKSDKIPKVHPDEIYRQGKRELWHIQDKMRQMEPVYKNKSEEAHYGGLTSLRMSLLTLIFRASQIAKQLHKKFYGLTLYECQKAMIICGTSNHTVRDNLRILVKMGLLKKTIRRIEGKVNEYAFYNIDMKSFPCQSGFYIVWGGSSSKDALFFISCPEFPHCSMQKDDCRILQHLNKLNTVLPTVIRTMKGKELVLTNTKKITYNDELVDENELEYYEDQPLWRKMEITNNILAWRSQNPPKSFKDCMREIRNEGIIISHEFIYDIIKKKNELDDEMRDDISDEEEIIDNDTTKTSKNMMHNIINDRIKQKKETTQNTDIFEESNTIKKEPIQFSKVNGELKVQIENMVKEMRSGDFPDSYSDIIDMVLDKHNIKIVRFEIMTIAGEF